MDEREITSAAQPVQLVELPDPETSRIRMEETKQLIAEMETIIETLLVFVDAGYSPVPVDEMHEMIRHIQEVGFSEVRRSLDQTRRETEALQAAVAALDHDNGGGGDEGIGLRQQQQNAAQPQPRLGGGGRSNDNGGRGPERRQWRRLLVAVDQDDGGAVNGVAP
uniref:Uncharacterized protein n=2 Tax=Oryza punctata TaxID=4537 RepID=A0A1V1H1U2_ORYPU|nr:hypothetical protein [Oryza punctata]